MQRVTTTSRLVIVEIDNSNTIIITKTAHGFEVEFQQEGDVRTLHKEVWED